MRLRKDLIKRKDLKKEKEHFVDFDETMIRPAEVDLLIGDASKAKTLLAWEPKIRFEGLVNIMVENDLRIEAEQNQLLLSNYRIRKPGDDLENFDEIVAFLEKLENARDDDHLRAMFNEYQTDYDLSISPDPFSEAYRLHQMELYKKFAGKNYSVSNEVTSFDVNELIKSPFP